MRPKYSLAEIERRWLVSPSFLSELDARSYRLIEDLYVEGTQLRVRKMSAPDGEAVYKFCKKYGRDGSLANAITNLYLTETEYKTLAALEGNRVRKRRYSIEGGVVDVYLELDALAIFEVEFDSEREAEGYVPPRFVDAEVTDDARWSGAALAAKARAS